MQLFVYLFVVFCFVTTVLSDEGLLLDSFTVNGKVYTDYYDFSVENGTSILGGERDMILAEVGYNPSREYFTSTVGSSIFNTTVPQGVYGFSVLQYDGYDNSPLLNPSGLGGIDLLRKGKYLGVTVSAYASDYIDDEDVNLFITIYSGSNISYCFTAFTLSPQPQSYFMDYYNFDIEEFGCEFDNVGAIEVSFYVNRNVTVIVDPISFVGLGTSLSSTPTPTASQTRTPTPTTSISHSATPTPTPTTTISITETRTPSSTYTPSIKPIK